MPSSNCGVLRVFLEKVIPEFILGRVCLVRCEGRDFRWRESKSDGLKAGQVEL